MSVEEAIQLVREKFDEKDSDLDGFLQADGTVVIYRVWGAEKFHCFDDTDFIYDNEKKLMRKEVNGEVVEEFEIASEK